MKDNKKSIFDIFKEKTYLFYALVIVLNIFLFVDNSRYMYISIAISGILILYSLIKSFMQKQDWKNFIDKINHDMLSASRLSVVAMPIPVIVTNTSGEIIWYNSKFKNISNIEDDIIAKDINSVFPLWNWEEIVDPENSTFDFNIENNYYKIFYTKDIMGDSDIICFYWFDETKRHMVEKKYDDEKTIVAHLQLDNFEEVLSSAKSNSSPFIISEVENLILKWGEKNKAVIHKTDDANYIFVINKENLIDAKNDKFKIIDDVRAIDVGNTIPVTLSVGISIDESGVRDIDRASKEALELALGRGGDQVVLKTEDNYEFYGGRSKDIERKSRVKARVLAQALYTLIKESGKIYIMGHKYPDLDAMGSAIGMHRAAVSLGKKPSIVLNSVDEAVSELMKKFNNKTGYNLLKTEEVLSRYQKNDLLIIVDTHRKQIVEAPELIDVFDKIVVIDHHRRSADAIDKASLLYIEPFASSAAEIVTEILQYIDEEVKLTSDEANALLSGIVLDTKNFTFKTGVRTFDSASYLRKKGANTLEVKEFFKDNFEDSIIKNKILTESFMHSNNIALSISKVDSENIKKIISQAADELLNIKGVKASFVIGKDINKNIFVSARSKGEINVQVILEKIGGGGHLEVAGAMFKDQSIEEVEKQLIDSLDEYMEEKK